MVPPVRPAPAVMDVTVPEPPPLPTQTPFTAKQPAERLIPFANVDEADDVTLSAVV